MDDGGKELHHTELLVECLIFLVFVFVLHFLLDLNLFDLFNFLLKFFEFFLVPGTVFAVDFVEESLLSENSLVFVVEVLKLEVYLF